MEAMRHSDPFLSSTCPVRPLDKKVPILPISIGVRHVRNKPERHLPHRKMVNPLGRGDMLGSMAPKELVKSKLTIPTTKMTPQDFLGKQMGTFSGIW